LVDWKSNWLGDRPEDYDRPGVEAAMRAHHYALQAYLYILAADRFLAARIPDYAYETHFGGVFYLFLRGVERGNPRRGIYRTRPPLALVEKLRALTALPKP
jgi:exodeoxyribonuclease V beta subunit